jgi:hypothetical protein
VPSKNPNTRRIGLILGAGLILIIGTGAGISYNRYGVNRTAVFTSDADHFKYGSIGGDVENGLPLEIMKVLPKAFPEYLPDATAKDYSAFGFVQEPGHVMPIGFSIRNHLVPRTGLTCSACHTGTLQVSENDEPRIYLGMPAVNMDLAGFFTFLFDAAGDERFNAEYLLPLMQANGAKLDVMDRIVYSRFVIPGMKKELLAKQQLFAGLFDPKKPAFGPGRVDTFNPYKYNQLAEHYPDGVPAEEAIGTSNYPSLWNMKARVGMAQNWDGNSPRVHDRDMGAAFGAGATRESIDVDAIKRVSDYVANLPAPVYPFGITKDAAVLARGEALYAEKCGACHAPNGARTGKVEPITQVKTDPYRLQSYTAKLNTLLLDYGKGYSWKLTEMHKTDGYANKLLDGVWLTAPYLHNGSVPTLWDLLLPEEQRPRTFYVGHGLYDTTRVGIRTDVATANGRKAFLFDTSLPGNSNVGHSGPYYGTDLSDADKRAVIEYMKTLH